MVTESKITILDKISNDLYVEATVIHDFLLSINNKDWNKNTDFKNWTPRDIIAHLHFFDLASISSISGNIFLKEKQSFWESIKSGKSTKLIAEEKFINYDSISLVNNWYKIVCELSESFKKLDLKTRLPWFGSEMSAPSFASARFMETWAHLQAIYDLIGVKRDHTDRIKHVAMLGVKTFKWTFLNRKLDIPRNIPSVILDSPTGTIWKWNEEEKINRIEGSAVDFCYVVAQVRNIADTKLIVVGNVAKSWMSIAQCFAGPPMNPPKQGARGN